MMLKFLIGFLFVCTRKVIGVLMDYSKIISNKLQGMECSGIRKFFDIVNKTDGVISLGVGEPDFKTPYKIRNKVISVLKDEQIKYTSNKGNIDLLSGISKYLASRINVSYDSNHEIMATVGGSEAIDLTVRSLINPGDEVIIIEPAFVSYRPIIEMSGGNVVEIATSIEDEFRLNPKDLENAITSKTKLLILSFPNNPTGAIMSRSDLSKIVDIIQKTNIMVISDEIYSELTYGQDHVSIAEFDGMKERTLIISGFSKAFSMTGWRLGYVAGPKEIISQMIKLHQYTIMCAPTISQIAAIEALRSCDEEVNWMREEYNKRRKYVVNELKKMGLNCFEPFGAFYVFPDIRSTHMSSDEFCEKLLEAEKVAVVSGRVFGKCGEGFVRVSYCCSMENLIEAMRRLRRFVKSLI